MESQQQMKDILELANLTKKDQVLLALKDGIVPFTGFCLEVDRKYADKAQKLLDQMYEWYKDAREFDKVVSDGEDLPEEKVVKVSDIVEENPTQTQSENPQ